MKIVDIKGRQIIDSRGNPTVEVDIFLEGGFFGRSCVPSGASTGTHEAKELRDGGKMYCGKGVLSAVSNVNTVIREALIDQTFESQRKLDELLIDLDGTDQKEILGANAILGVSVAFAKAVAKSEQKELFEYFSKISESENISLPVPTMNILNGGEHADSNVDIQEFMIAPVGAKDFSEAIKMGVEVYHFLKSLLKKDGLSSSVGDEGGFAPNLSSNEDALKYIMKAIEGCGYIPGEDIALCLDVAATELFGNGLYIFSGEGVSFSSDELIKYYINLCDKYPIISIEDGLSEDDWDGWGKLTKQLSGKIDIVGDDLYVTNVDRLKKGIKNNSSNAILIKLNQIGTVSETIDAIKLSQQNNMTAIVSHRSGETEDTTIADLAVGLNSGFIKTGAPCRTDRVAKYNRLLRIEEFLGEKCSYGRLN